MPVISMTVDKARCHFESHPTASRRPNRDERVISPVLLYRSESHSVYSGILPSRGDGCGSLCHPNVVIKLARNRRAMQSLAREHSMYTGKLRSLQGIYIPRYHGLYYNRNGRGPLACIVLEYCNDPVGHFSLLKKEFKSQLVEAVTAIHTLGVTHRHISEGHVLDHDGRPKIIDFGLACEEKCQLRIDLCQGDVAPSPADVGCRELDILCTVIRFWRPSSMRFGCLYFPVQWMKEPWKLADAASRYPDPEFRMRMACEAVEKHMARWYPDDWEKERATYRLKTERLCAEYVRRMADPEVEARASEVSRPCMFFRRF
ncbi:hypothetical protein OF83DRAFT_1169639 [Amylostereum chailletii]|nr:hypothetical protein OF83DRAFT_1169639 [Amylostereum chailletii]